MRLFPAAREWRAEVTGGRFADFRNGEPAAIIEMTFFSASGTCARACARDVLIKAGIQFRECYKIDTPNSEI